MAITATKTPKVIIETQMGPITVELYPDKAPITVANFLNYTTQGLFDGSSIFRIVNKTNSEQEEDANARIQVVQAGLPPEHPKLLPPIAHETTEQTGIMHEDGVIFMARFEPGSADGSFCFSIGDQPELNYGGKRYADGLGFATFGRIIRGRDVLQSIYEMAEEREYLQEEIRILKVYQL